MHSVNQARLELRDLPTSFSKVLILKVCVRTDGHPSTISKEDGAEVIYSGVSIDLLIMQT